MKRTLLTRHIGESIIFTLEGNTVHMKGVKDGQQMVAAETHENSLLAFGRYSDIVQDAVTEYGFQVEFEFSAD